MTMSKNALPPLGVWSYLAEYAELREDILRAVDAVFSSGRLVLGERVAAFEREFAASLGLLGGVGVNSGTDALHIGLAAGGVGPGTEVITVPNTAVPTVSAIVTAGATPVFVDINRADYLIDVEQIRSAITPRTKAILPVHLYGQCADMDAICRIAAEHNLFVLEDCAQAQGARNKGRQAGTMGKASAFSFYPTKILGAYGDGGWVGSNDKDLNDLAKSMRMYGMSGTYYAERHGFNSRLDEVQAAILSLKLPFVERWIKRRRQIAERYAQGLQKCGLRLPAESKDNFHVYYVYVVEHPERERVMRGLADRGINCNISYPYPIHTMRGYAHLDYREGQFPVTEEAAKRVFSLPMYPYLSDAEVDRVIEAVVEACNG